MTLINVQLNVWLWLSLGDHAFLYIKRKVFFQLYIQVTSISGSKFQKNVSIIMTIIVKEKYEENTRKKKAKEKQKLNIIQ